METCPNCGQPGRPGARFCTSCGFRLPERPVEPPAATEPSPLSRSPFATTSTVAASWWPSANPSPEPPPPVYQESPAAPTSDASASARSETVDAADGPAASDAAGVSEASTSETDAATADAPAPAFPVWPSFPSYENQAATGTDSWSGAKTGFTGPPGGKEDLAAAVEAMAGPGETEEADAPPEPDPAPVVEEESAPVVFAAPSTDAPAAPAPFAWREEPSAISDLLAQPAAATARADDDGESLARALSLVDELRSLLPSLVAPAAATPEAAGNDGLVEILARARDEATASQAGLEALMAVVQTARDRPRDIDVMLDLIRHADAIAELKSGYDRALAGIDFALAEITSE